jgi:tetratricopeptide (TPR) repeat protein
MDEFSARIDLNWKRSRAGEYAEAIHGFTDLLRDDPANTDGLYGLGLTLRAAGRSEEARTRFVEALDAVKSQAQPGGQEGSGSFVDDRALMLARMLEQRLNELEG